MTELSETICPTCGGENWTHLLVNGGTCPVATERDRARIREIFNPEALLDDPDDDEV